MYLTFKYKFKELNLTISKIEMVMGYKTGESEETISQLISEVLAEVETICDIKCEYRIFYNIKFNNEEKTAEIDNHVYNLKNIIFNQLKGADSAAIFLCTAGEEPDIRSRKAMKEGDLLRGYVFDVIGNEVVEAAVDLMQNNLETTLFTKGLKITNRFSPGYCGWDVAEQHKLFQLMPGNYCGIRLTPSALMKPMKSVSGIIGIGKNVKRNPYTCNMCNMNNCIYRNARNK